MNISDKDNERVLCSEIAPCARNPRDPRRRNTNARANKNAGRAGVAPGLGGPVGVEWVGGVLDLLWV